MLGTVTIKVLLSHFVFRLPFSFVTDDVVQATCQCLLAQASNAENVSLVCCSANLRRINELHLHFNKCAQRRIICKVKLYRGSCATSCTTISNNAYCGSYVTRKTVPCVGHEIFANCLTSFLWARKATVRRRLGALLD